MGSYSLHVDNISVRAVIGTIILEEIVPAWPQIDLTTEPPRYSMALRSPRRLMTAGEVGKEPLACIR
ncbi:hypothetical protein BO443_110259 [Burkholderia orbicola]